jgi:hypothetical protein
MRQYTAGELDQITAAEKELASKHGLMLLDNSPAAKANALVLTEYFNNNDVAMNVSAIVAAAYALKDKLDWKSPAQVEFSEILARLEPAECLVVNAWLKKQRRLKTTGDEGFSNISQIASWLLDRRYGVTESGLDMALTNVQNNSRRKFFWHDGPKQSREYVQGKPNHAFGAEVPKTATAQSEFHPNGRRNHSYTPPENAAKKPVEAPDAWQEICQLHLKQWITQGQRAKLEAEYNAGIATGKSWREIGTALGQIVKGWERGRLLVSKTWQLDERAV